MRSTLSALARWSAIGGLWLLILALIPLTALTHWLSGRGLFVAEWAKHQLSDLRGRA